MFFTDALQLAVAPPSCFFSLFLMRSVRKRTGVQDPTDASTVCMRVGDVSARFGNLYAAASAEPTLHRLDYSSF